MAQAESNILPRIGATQFCSAIDVVELMMGVAVAEFLNDSKVTPECLVDSRFHSGAQGLRETLQHCRAVFRCHTLGSSRMPQKRLG
jgi:hypothetical protein